MISSLSLISLLEIPAFHEPGRFFAMYNCIPIAAAACVFIADYRFRIHPFILIVSSAIIGIILL